MRPIKMAPWNQVKSPVDCVIIIIILFPLTQYFDSIDYTIYRLHGSFDACADTYIYPAGSNSIHVLLSAPCLYSTYYIYCFLIVLI